MFSVHTHIIVYCDVHLHIEGKMSPLKSYRGTHNYVQIPARLMESPTGTLDSSPPPPARGQFFGVNSYFLNGCNSYKGEWQIREWVATQISSLHNILIISFLYFQGVYLTAILRPNWWQGFVYSSWKLQSIWFLLSSLLFQQCLVHSKQSVMLIEWKLAPPPVTLIFAHLGRKKQGANGEGLEHFIFSGKYVLFGLSVIGYIPLTTLFTRGVSEIRESDLAPSLSTNIHILTHTQCISKWTLHKTHKHRSHSKSRSLFILHISQPILGSKPDST